MPSDTYIIHKVPIKRVDTAYAYFASHPDVTARPSVIWPRDISKISEFAVEGELYAVSRKTSDEIVGLCYAHYDAEARVYEIGGLLVSPEFRGKQLGTRLVAACIAHVVSAERPWNHGRTVIAMVHEDNEAPRKIFERFGFAVTARETVPDHIAPPEMKKNADGKLVGDRFEFPREKVADLLSWFESSVAESGDVLFEYEFGAITLAGLLDDLREDVEEQKKSVQERPSK